MLYCNPLRQRGIGPSLTGLLKYCVSLVFLLLCPLSPVCLVRSTKQTEEEGQ